MKTSSLSVDDKRVNVKRRLGYGWPNPNNWERDKEEKNVSKHI